MFKMRYRPDWRKIIFLAVLFQVAFVSAMSLNFSTAEKVEVEEDLQEIEWIENEVAEDSAVEQVAENFQPIEFPQIPELPSVPETVIEKFEPPKPAEVEKPVEKPAEDKKSAEEKSKTEDTRGKIVVLMKVYPKDIFEQLMAAGILKERPVLKSGKIVVAISVGFDGKMKNVEIRRGGGTDEMGNLINIVSEAAASAWVFAPYVDEDGNPTEIKTQIEFKPEDF